MQSLETYLTKKGWKEDLDQTVDDLFNFVDSHPNFSTATGYLALLGGSIGTMYLGGALATSVRINPSQPGYLQIYNLTKLIFGLGIGMVGVASFIALATATPFAIFGAMFADENYKNEQNL